MDLTQLQEIAAKERQTQQNKIVVRCCTSTGCQASQSLQVKEQLDGAVKAADMSDRVRVVGVGCMGFCGQGPIVEIQNGDISLFEKVTPEQAPSIIESLNGGTATALRGNHKHPFFARQMPIVREHSGKIDPERIEDYISYRFEMGDSC